MLGTNIAIAEPRALMLRARTHERGAEGCSRCERSFFVRWLYAVLREISALRVFLKLYFSGMRMLAKFRTD